MSDGIHHSKIPLQPRSSAGDSQTFSTDSGAWVFPTWSKVSNSHTFGRFYVFAFLSLCYHSIPSWHLVLHLKRKAKIAALGALPPAFLLPLLIPQAAPSSSRASPCPAAFPSSGMPGGVFRQTLSLYNKVKTSEYPTCVSIRKFFGRAWNAAGSFQLWILACFISLYASLPLKIHLMLEGLVSGIHCNAVHSKTIVPSIHYPHLTTPTFCAVSGSALILLLFIITVETVRIFSNNFMQVLHGFSFTLFFRMSLGGREKAVPFSFSEFCMVLFWIGRMGNTLLSDLPLFVFLEWREPYPAQGKFLLETTGSFNFIFTTLKGSLWLKPV